MNYEKIYNCLIKKRKDNPIIKYKSNNPNYIYCEKHHIIPASCHGSNDKSNLINLLPKEHYIAHLLLLKIYELKYGKDHPYYKNMVCALQLLSNRKIFKRSDQSFIVFKIPSRQYEKIRNLYSELRKGQKPWNAGKHGIFSEETLKIMVEHHKDMHGKNNGMYGKRGILCPTFGRKLSKETCELMSKNRSGIPVSKEARHKMSLAKRGKNSPMYGKTYMYNPEIKQKRYVKPDEIEQYRKLGYKFKIGKYKYI